MPHKSPKISQDIYKRGKTRITGNSPEAKKLMFIDLITSKLFWIAVFMASIYLEHKTGILAAFLDLIVSLIRGEKTSHG